MNMFCTNLENLTTIELNPINGQNRNNSILAWDTIT